MDVGSNIKIQREKAGLTQKELAKLLGVTKQRVSKIEATAQGVTTKTMWSICKALGCTPNDLFGIKK